jgi:hypothetical protein
MVEWNIQSRAHACQACGRGFQNRETLHTVLFDERQEYLRQDVCEACWQSQYGDGANHRRGFVSHWQTVYEPPPASPPEPIQKETAETLLRKLVELNDPRHAGAVFILAVMLERKRLLKVKGQATQDGRRILVYEHARTGDVLTIPDPQLQLDQLEAVQRDVAHLLEHGLEETAGAIASAATATPPVAENPPAEVAGAQAAPEPGA